MNQILEFRMFDDRHLPAEELSKFVKLNGKPRQIRYDRMGMIILNESSICHCYHYNGLDGGPCSYATCNHMLKDHPK